MFSLLDVLRHCKRGFPTISIFQKAGNLRDMPRHLSLVTRQLENKNDR